MEREVEYVGSDIYTITDDDGVMRSYNVVTKPDGGKTLRPIFGGKSDDR